MVYSETGDTPMNTLYYGDNLNILREYIKDETVDLIYLEPPVNVQLKKAGKAGAKGPAQEGLGI